MEDFFELLSPTRRRHIIYALESAEDDVHDYDDILEFLVEYGDTEADREHLVAELHHTHCPMLEDLGVIDYDPRSQTIRYRGDSLLSHFVEEFANYELEE